MLFVYESLSGRPVLYPVRRAIRFKAVPPGGRFENGYDSWNVWSGEQFLRLESGVWVHQPEPTLDADREATTDQAVRWFRDHPMHLRWDDTGGPMTADDLRSRWRIAWGIPEELWGDHAATFGPPDSPPSIPPEAAAGPSDTPPPPAAPADAPPASGPTVDDRAAALLTRWLRENRPVSVSAIADALGVSRQHLYRCQTFQVLWKAHEADKTRLPRGSKDRASGRLEAWRDED